MSKIMLYGCGGAGINVISKFLQYRNKHEQGYSDFDLCFVDTSHSNIKENIPADLVYHIDGLDGSGKKRDSNYKPISERVKDIAQKYKPGDINLVVHSASGGSGSVIGPILAGEISAKHPTIVVLVGSSDSKIETDNTIKTIKSYDAITKKKGWPLAALYFENNANTGRAVVDNSVHIAIILISILFSGSNAELDSADLNNFLHYNKVTSYEPALCALHFGSKEISTEKDQTVASVVSLTSIDIPAVLNIPVEYQAVGFIDDAIKEVVTSSSGNIYNVLDKDLGLPLHFYTVLGYFNKKVEELNHKLNGYIEHRATITQKSVVSEDETNNIENEHGLLF